MSTPLLWHSNAPFSSTGYGQQTQLFTPLLNESYDVTISSFYGLNGSSLVWDGIRVLPGFEGDYGNASLPMHVPIVFGKPRDGLVLSLMDVWVLDPAVMRQYNMACWVPVDHDPAPPRVLEFFRQSNAIPIAMSRFGERMLGEFNPLYVPHGVDTEVYKPLDRDEAREITGIPKDRYVVGMVAANKGNPSRKAFAENLTAFKAFHDEHPDALLYLHTEMTGVIDGVHIPELMKAVGLDGKDVVFCDQYRTQLAPFAPDIMAAIYNSLDVLLAASCGEGFGIPVLEAQACGVPVIVTDFSAQAELVGAGWKVEWTPYYTVQRSFQAHPSVVDIHDALRQAFCANGAHLAKQAREFALGYDAKTVLDKHFLPALQEVEKRVEARKPIELAAA